MCFCPTAGLIASLFTSTFLKNVPQIICELLTSSTRHTHTATLFANVVCDEENLVLGIHHFNCKRYLNSDQTVFPSHEIIHARQPLRRAPCPNWSNHGDIDSLKRISTLSNVRSRHRLTSATKAGCLIVVGVSTVLAAILCCTRVHAFPTSRLYSTQNCKEAAKVFPL